MALFNIKNPLPTPSLPVPIVGPLAGALLGGATGAAGGTTAASSATPTATNAANATQPFQIHVANPVTGAIQIIQGTAQAGLSNLDAGAKAVLANAPEIPILHQDGSVTVVPGGADGLQALQDNVVKVLSSAPAAAKLDPVGTVGAAVNGIAAAVTATTNGAAPATTTASNPALPNPFQLLPNPITGAASIVQGTFDAGVHGLDAISQKAIGNAPQLPVVLPSGQLSIVKGGLDGLAALKDDAHKVLENAPLLPHANAAAGALGGTLLGVAGGALSAVSGGANNPLAMLQSSASLISNLSAMPQRAEAIAEEMLKAAHEVINFLTSPDVGPAEIDAAVASNANVILKGTVLAIASATGAVILGVTAVIFLGTVLLVVGVPVLVALIWVLGFEVLLWRHWRNVVKTRQDGTTAPRALPSNGSTSKPAS